AAAGARSAPIGKFLFGCSRGGRRFRRDLASGLVLAQAFEGRLAHLAGGRPTGELDLGYKLRFHPAHLGPPARRILAGERARLAGERLQSRHESCNLLAPESGSDFADVYETTVAVHADEQRAKLPGLLRPTADHHFLAAAALCLDPVVAAAGAVRRVETLGDDALEIHAAGRLEHRVARRLEVLRVSQPICIVRSLTEQRLQPRLALAQREFAQVFAVLVEQIEREVHE